MKYLCIVDCEDGDNAVYTVEADSVEQAKAMFDDHACWLECSHAFTPDEVERMMDSPADMICQGDDPAAAHLIYPSEPEVCILCDEPPTHGARCAAHADRKQEAQP